MATLTARPMSVSQKNGVAGSSGNPFQQHRLLVQIKEKPISFQRARLPEPQAIKPASYTLIKPEKEQKDVTTTIGANGGSQQGQGQSGSVETDGIMAQASFYDLDELKNDPGSRKPSKINKSWSPGTASPIGLINKGVTCYMNSAVQLLMHTPAMSHYLGDVSSGSVKLPRDSVTADLAALHSKMFTKAGKKSCIFPKQLIYRLEDINCMMSEWQQEDAHEYFMSLMSRLQEDSTPKGAKLNSSIIYDLFGGDLQQTVICGACQHHSITKQDFYDLSISLGDEKNGQYSLKKCITRFFEQEKIQKKEGYKCDKCNKTTNALKSSRINSFPEYLPVHMKRFKFTNEQGRKIQSGISYPAELDLGHYSVDNKSSEKYRLIGIITHCGRTVSSGHYIAMCRQPNGTWAQYDDELVQKMTEKQALKEEDAYMLLYQKLTKKPEEKKPEVVRKVMAKPGLKSGKKRQAGDIDNIFASAKRKKHSGRV